MQRELVHTAVLFYHYHHHSSKLSSRKLTYYAMTINFLLHGMCLLLFSNTVLFHHFNSSRFVLRQFQNFPHFRVSSVGGQGDVEGGAPALKRMKSDGGRR